MVYSNIFISLSLILHKFILQDLCSIICVICVPFSVLVDVVQKTSATINKFPKYPSDVANY